MKILKILAILLALLLIKNIITIPNIEKTIHNKSNVKKEKTIEKDITIDKNKLIKSSISYTNNKNLFSISYKVYEINKKRNLKKNFYEKNLNNKNQFFCDYEKICDISTNHNLIPTKTSNISQYLYSYQLNIITEEKELKNYFLINEINEKDSYLIKKIKNIIKRENKNHYFFEEKKYKLEEKINLDKDTYQAEYLEVYSYGDFLIKSKKEKENFYIIGNLYKNQFNILKK
jgi:hypothetical protein